MKKCMSFYHLMVEVYSEKSGNTQIVFDDYYTQQIVGSYEQFDRMMKGEIAALNSSENVREVGAAFTYTLTTCCFNNGTGRSSASQTNIQPYSVKDNVPQLRSIRQDQTFNEAIMSAMDWLADQKAPF